jgi:surface protein
VYSSYICKWWRASTRLCDEAPLVASFDISAMYGAAVWHGTAGALGFVRCDVDGVGPALQAFYSAKAFNQNIGSWNTASVSNMNQACALLPSHACGAAQP